MRKRTKAPSGTWLEYNMAKSEAYNSLKGWSAQLLTHFLMKRDIRSLGRKSKEKRVCVNCDSITFTYVEAEKKYHINKPRFARAIDDLLAKGFITIIRRGGAYKKDKTVYGLSDKWIIWKPGMVFEQREKESVERGFCRKKQKSHT